MSQGCGKSFLRHGSVGFEGRMWEKKREKAEKRGRQLNTCLGCWVVHDSWT